jgi:hypothetical protein
VVIQRLLPHTHGLVREAQVEKNSIGFNYVSDGVNLPLINSLEDYFNGEQMNFVGG